MDDRYTENDLLDLELEYGGSLTRDEKVLELIKTLRYYRGQPANSTPLIEGMGALIGEIECYFDIQKEELEELAEVLDCPASFTKAERGAAIEEANGMVKTLLRHNDNAKHDYVDGLVKQWGELDQ